MQRPGGGFGGTRIRLDQGIFQPQVLPGDVAQLRLKNSIGFRAYGFLMMMSWFRCVAGFGMNGLTTTGSNKKAEKEKKGIII